MVVVKGEQPSEDAQAAPADGLAGVSEGVSRYRYVCISNEPNLFSIGDVESGGVREGAADGGGDAAALEGYVAARASAVSASTELSESMEIADDETSDSLEDPLSAPCCEVGLQLQKSIQKLEEAVVSVEGKMVKVRRHSMMLSPKKGAEFEESIGMPSILEGLEQKQADLGRQKMELEQHVCGQSLEEHQATLKVTRRTLLLTTRLPRA